MFLKRLLGLFGRPGVTIPGTDQLAEGQARKVDIGDPFAGGKQILLCRVDGKIHALDATCPHEGGRIVPGDLQEGRLAVCPLHGYRFDATNGKAVGVACPPARTYRTRERDGNCEVWV